MDDFDKIQIKAAEDYIANKRNNLLSTVEYKFKNTINYLISVYERVYESNRL